MSNSKQQMMTRKIKECIKTIIQGGGGMYDGEINGYEWENNGAMTVVWMWSKDDKCWEKLANWKSGNYRSQNKYDRK